MVRRSGRCVGRACGGRRNVRGAVVVAAAAAVQMVISTRGRRRMTMARVVTCAVVVTSAAVSVRTRQQLGLVELLAQPVGQRQRRLGHLLRRHELAVAYLLQRRLVQLAEVDQLQQLVLLLRRLVWVYFECSQFNNFLLS